MPAGPIGTCWAPGSWSDTAWEVGTWAGVSVPVPPVQDHVGGVSGRVVGRIAPFRAPAVRPPDITGFAEVRLTEFRFSAHASVQPMRVQGTADLELSPFRCESAGTMAPVDMRGHAALTISPLTWYLVAQMASKKRS